MSAWRLKETLKLKETKMRIKGKYGFMYKVMGHWHYKSYFIGCNAQRISMWSIPKYYFNGNGIDKGLRDSEDKLKDL